MRYIFRNVCLFHSSIKYVSTVYSTAGLWDPVGFNRFCRIRIRERSWIIIQVLNLTKFLTILKDKNVEISTFKMSLVQSIISASLKITENVLNLNFNYKIWIFCYSILGFLDRIHQNQKSDPDLNRIARIRNPGVYNIRV